ncbi:polysaccharide pyruvyl transferase family protein [Rhizobium acaciae]|uniref:polysaccharide pyruvyl transferase family protein n=1 Tax=Rhizobium acaciae TaxID=2989736 RepID=UPI003F99B95D
MKIAIENTVALNAGDAAILIAIIKILRLTFGEDAKFYVFDRDPKVASRYYPDIDFYPSTVELLKAEPTSIPLVGKRSNIRIRRNIQRIIDWYWKRLMKGDYGKRFLDLLYLPIPFTSQLRRNIRIYSQADLVVSTGGTYLVEHYNMDTCFAEFEKDFALGKPLVLFTQSLGPYEDPKNIAEMKKVVTNAKLILLRDEKSEKNLRMIGVDSNNLAVVSDSVFAFADIQTLQSPFPGIKQRRMRVAVSVRKWQHFDNLSADEGMERYTQSVARAVNALIKEKNCEVVFLSTCQGIEEYRYDDSRVGQEIYEMLDVDAQRSASVDRDFHTPHELMEKLRHFDFVISTRMHMAILALCVGVPVLPIAYEFKTTELFGNLKQAEWVTDISDMDPEAFWETALRFSEQLETFYKSAAPELIKQAASALDGGKLTATAAQILVPTTDKKV